MSNSSVPEPPLCRMIVPLGVPVGCVNTIVAFRSGSPAQETVTNVQVAVFGAPGLGHVVGPIEDTVPSGRRIGVTVSVVVPLIEFRVALREVVPAKTLVTSPVLLMVAVLELDELHTTCVVKSWKLPSL